MKRLRAKMIGAGTEEDPFRVNLPTYIIDCQRDEAVKPLKDKDGKLLDSIDYEKKTCFVLVPDDEVDENGRLNQEKIRKKYKEHWSEFKTEDVEA